VQEISKVIHSPNIRKPDKHECKIYNQSLHALYFMCCFNQRRDVIAREGAIPIMRAIVLNNLPLQEFALPLLCGFAVGASWKTVIQEDPDLSGYYYILRENLNWASNSLNSIFELLYHDTQIVEQIMTKSANVVALVELFTKNPRQRVEDLVAPLQKIFALSERVTLKCASDGKLPKLFSSWLRDLELGQNVDAGLLRALLSVLDSMFDVCIKQQVKAFDVSSLDAVRSLVQFTQGRGLAMASEAVELQQKLEKYFA
jgi:hypothetical protein